LKKRRSQGEGTIYFNINRDCWVAQIVLPTGRRKSKSSKVQGEVIEWLPCPASYLSFATERECEDYHGVEILDEALRRSSVLTRASVSIYASRVHRDRHSSIIEAAVNDLSQTVDQLHPEARIFAPPCNLC